MRLVDQVVQGGLLDAASLPDGRSFELIGPGTFAERIRGCEVRYILDRAASRQCADLFRSAVEMPSPDDAITRLPAERFWIEFYADGDGDGPDVMQSGRRAGLLAEVSPDGRSGTLVCFNEKNNDRAEYLGCTVAFDLDGTRAFERQPGKTYRIRQADLPEVDRLLDHARLVLDDRWRAYAAAHPKGYAYCISATANLAWSALPIVVCFSALLNAPKVLDQQPSDLARLNVARRQRGRPPLLDHVEVKLDLSSSSFQHAARGDPGARRAPRLHFVRGHLVRRAGMTFWRTSHFRGEIGEASVRTVAVTSGTRRRSAEKVSASL